MYLREIRLNWRPLLAASIGIGLGSALGYYTLSLFGPALLAEFGWSRAQFALVGSLPLFTLFLVPVAGRFADRFGARIAAMVGFTAMPLGFVAFTFMRGSIAEFFAIYVVQNIFGILTTSFVFCRIVVERFDRARGIALSILMTGPPLAGAIAAPVLGDLIQTEGWRAGYLALALLSCVGGWLAILLMDRDTRRVATKDPELRLTRQELFTLLRHPTFLLLVAGMLLVNVPQVLASSQLKLVVLDNGVTDATATWMVSLYATGVIVGRFVSGFALDRVAAHVVAIFTLGLPAIGFLILASPLSAIWILSAAVLVIGLAQGAEGDLGAFLISRRFDMKNYSLLLSFLTVAIIGGSAIGSLVLSYSLLLTDSYTPFLLISAAATIVGALLFFLTGGRKLQAAIPPPVAREVA
jgi:predicted MFS family arabinose efflux permease